MTKRSVGEIAPDITARDAKGNNVSFDSIGKEYVLVAFLRYAGCPFCNLSIHRFAMEHQLLLDSGCEVLTFIQSDIEAIEKNIYDRHKVTPKFAIIPDHDKKFYKLFDVTPSYKNTYKMIKDIPHWIHAVKDHGFKQGKVDGNFLIAPALFLVHTKTRKILHADYAADLFEHETFSPIYDKILTLQT